MQGGHWSLKSLNVLECSWILLVLELFLENVGFSHLVFECFWIFAIQWIMSNCMWMFYVSTGYQCLLKLFENNFFPWKPIFCSWNVLKLFLNFFIILSGHPLDVSRVCLETWKMNFYLINFLYVKINTAVWSFWAEAWFVGKPTDQVGLEPSS